MELVSIDEYVPGFYAAFPQWRGLSPWQVVQALSAWISAAIPQLEGYLVRGDIAIHPTAEVSDTAILKGPLVINEGCYVGSHACLRGSVWLGEGARVGHSCEVKTSLMMDGAAVAHFNFVGDSIVGRKVNFEAGAIAANHFNEREMKDITVLHGGTLVNTGTTKFGVLAGDNSRIGANAVLTPGTLLPPSSVVGRLQLLDQVATIR